MKQTYRGRCHCGKVRFEVDADLDHVRICDCSICRARGALNHRLHQEIVKALAQPDVRAKLADQGLEPIGNSPEELAAVIRSETATWAKVVKDANIQPE
jgi:hypothetical protein